MRLHIEKENKNLRLTFDGPVKLLLSQFRIDPNEVIVSRGDEILQEEDSITNKDSIRISHIVKGRA